MGVQSGGVVLHGVTRITFGEGRPNRRYEGQRIQLNFGKAIPAEVAWRESRLG